MADDRTTSERRQQYLEKLRDPRWQKMRLKVFERDEWVCQICFDEGKTLNVHHRYYLSQKEPWEYPMEALVTLCEECHRDETQNRSEEEQLLLRALREKFFSSEINQLAIGIHSMPLLHTAEVVASVYEWALQTPEIQRELIEKYFDYLKRKRKRSPKS